MVNLWRQMIEDSGLYSRASPHQGFLSFGASTYLSTRYQVSRRLSGTGSLYTALECHEQASPSGEARFTCEIDECVCL